MIKNTFSKSNYEKTINLFPIIFQYHPHITSNEMIPRLKDSFASSFKRFKHNAVDHIIKVHNLMPAGSKMYRCLVNRESCRYETYQKTRIVFHFKIQHKEDYGGQVHHCDKCVKTFNWPHMLRTHMRQAHPEPGEDKPKPFQCPECGHLSK